MTRIKKEETNWESEIIECTVAGRLPDLSLQLPIYGCSDNGQFCHISPRINHNSISYREGRLHAHDIILEIQGYKVSGYTKFDLEELIVSLTVNCEPIIIKTVSKNRLPSTLKEYLSHVFPTNSFDQDLQRVIRDNVYLRVVPCTTRMPRLGEINGIDYQFMTIDEFMDLDRADGLLESGMFDGNYYGTPKPSSYMIKIPNAGSLEENPSLPSSTDIEDRDLGPLPDQWEVAFTEDNFMYFIDHNTGTTQWNDPRLPEDTLDENVADLKELQIDESLPFGWEKVYDPKYGLFYIDHINKRTQYDAPDALATMSNSNSLERTFTSTTLSNMAISNLNFTKDPSKLTGTIVRTTLIKSPRGFGFTIIGGSDRSKPEFLQIKDVMAGGPASVDGRLETGDVLVFVDNCLVLGYLHADIVALFQKILIGQQVTLTVCKGYLMPYDINDPRAHVVTTMAVDNMPLSALNGTRPSNDVYPAVSSTSEGSSSSAKSSHSTGGSNNDMTMANANFFAEKGKPEFIKINILKSCNGFGFTISDNSPGQRVKQILEPGRCGRLKEGDILVEINKTRIKEKSHQEVVQILKECPEGLEVALLIQRGGVSAQTSSSGSSGYSGSSRLPVSSAASMVPILPAKSTSVDHPAYPKNITYPGLITPTNLLSQSLLESHDTDVDRRGMSDLAVANYLSHQPNEDSFNNSALNTRSRTPGPDNSSRKLFYQDPKAASVDHYYCNEPYSSEYNSVPRRPKTPTADDMRTSYYWDPQSGQTPNFVPCSVLLSESVLVEDNINSNEHKEPQNNQAQMYGSLSRHQNGRSSASSVNTVPSNFANSDSMPQVFFVTLNKQSNGFGFRIIGGAEDNTIITIGPLVPDGAAMRSGQVRQGDELVSVNGAGVVGGYHKKVVQLVAAASRLGSVTLGLRRPSHQLAVSSRRGPFDVILDRSETDGFGFVIVTSMTKTGAHMGEYIGKLIENSPAEQCGVLRVDDRIVAVNGVSVAKMRHEKIVQTIKNCGRSVTLRIHPVGGENNYRCGTSGSIGSQESSDPGSSVSSSIIVGGGDEFEITLARGNNGFGFSIRGGQDFNKMPLFVLRVAEEGPAKADGRLKVGDRILQINGKNTASMTHNQAINMIQGGGNVIRLLVRRSMEASRLQESVYPHSSPGSTSSTSKRPVIPPHYSDYNGTHRKC